MGFLSSLWSNVKQAAKWVAKKVGLIDEEIGESKSVTNDSTVSDIGRMSTTLNSYSKTYEKLAQDHEERCILYVDNYFNELIADLKELEELYQGIDIKRLTDTQNAICRQIRGAYIKPIRNRLSLDDNECRDIIKLAAGPSKTAKMHDFSNRVFCEANCSLIKSVDVVLRQQAEEINAQMSKYVIKKENHLNLMHMQYEKIEKQFEDGSFDKEKTQMVPQIKINLVNQILNVIEG